ncbi:DUF2304 family protein [Candidatus Falkowbacteria bacterium]|nr:DUF2304 family protein [Candidatus Falkowbacteria bacterium]
MAIKIILLIFILFVVLRTVFRFTKKEIRGRELVAWLVFWVLVGSAVALPQTTDVLAGKVGVSRGADLLVYISVLVLFYLVFKVLVKLEKIERQMTEVVREKALKEKGD